MRQQRQDWLNGGIKLEGHTNRSQITRGLPTPPDKSLFVHFYLQQIPRLTPLKKGQSREEGWYMRGSGLRPHLLIYPSLLLEGSLFGVPQILLHVDQDLTIPP
jgi:hypothetical protein